jgi:hypothetical protein
MDEFLKWYFSGRPVAAANLGAEGYDHTLGDFSATAFTDRARDELRWLERLSALEPATPDDAIDRDLVLSQLRGSIALEAWPDWRRDPGGYLGTVFSALYTPLQRRLKPEGELVAAALSRLAEVPGVLAACRANLDPELAAPLLVKRGDQVLMLARHEAVEVSTSGEALDAGSRGQVIRVKNSASGQVVRMRVTGAGTVEPLGIGRITR